MTAFDLTTAPAGMPVLATQPAPCEPSSTTDRDAQAGEDDLGEFTDVHTTGNLADEAAAWRAAHDARGGAR